MASEIRCVGPVFKVDSLDATFEKLHHLDIISTKKELLKEATLGEDGKTNEIRNTNLGITLF